MHACWPKCAVHAWTMTSHSTIIYLNCTLPKHKGIRTIGGTKGLCGTLD